MPPAIAKRVPVGAVELPSGPSQAPLPAEAFEENAGASHRRRRALLKGSLPNLEELESPDPREAVVAAVVLVAHVGVGMYVAPQLGWLALAALAYLLGTLLAHMTFLGMHEASHDLMLPGLWANRIMGWYIQIPLVIPVSSLFRKFHALHHARQASQFDPDEPSPFEERWFLSHLPGRVAWACSQYLWYIVRPLLMSNVKVPWAFDDTLCVAHQCVVAVLFTLASQRLYGDAYLDAMRHTLGYFVLSIMFAMGPSVYSAHFLTEHRRSSVEPYPIGALELTTVAGTGKQAGQQVQLPEVPTYSYYGIVNFVSYFVGYHCEHHDFPTVPGFKLPRLNKELAPTRAYIDRPFCPSYLGGLIDFVLRPYINAVDTQPERFQKADSTVLAAGTAQWYKATQLTHEVDPMDEPRNGAAGTDAAPAPPSSATRRRNKAA